MSAHVTHVSPIDGGPRHRSECDTCGTVLRLHDTEAEAEAHAATHRLVEAVKAYALDHYEDGGWDVIVECWDDEQIAEHLRHAEADDLVDPALAIDAFRGVVGVWADRQADARNSVF